MNIIAKKNTLIIAVVAALSLGVPVAATSNNSLNSESDLQLPLLGSNIPQIDSSHWAVDPVKKWGVTAQEYIHMEHQFMANLFQGQAGINQFFHFQGLSTKDMVWVVSPNQDTVYSIAAVDATGDFSITVPDMGDRFVSVHVQDFNHVFVAYEYGGGTYHYKASDIDTDYVIVGVRVGTDTTEQDIQQITELYQPQMKIEAQSNKQHIVNVDKDLMLEMRAAFIEQFQNLETPFGWVQYSLNDISNWENMTYTIANSFGLSHESTAMYKNGFPNAKGGDCYYGKFDPVPYQAFASVTAYGHDRYLMTNYQESANSVGTNHHNWIENDDGSFEVIFGAESCRQEGINFVAAPEDNWHFMVRAYQPDMKAMAAYQVPTLIKMDDDNPAL